MTQTLNPLTVDYQPRILQIAERGGENKLFISSKWACLFLVSPTITSLPSSCLCSPLFICLARMNRDLPRASLSLGTWCLRLWLKGLQWPGRVRWSRMTHQVTWEYWDILVLESYWGPARLSPTHWASCYSSGLTILGPLPLDSPFNGQRLWYTCNPGLSSWGLKLRTGALPLGCSKL